MNDPHLLGRFVRRFLLEELVADRNLSVNTQRSYRDTIKLLFDFLFKRHAIDPTGVTVEHVSADVVRGFLTHLEEQRGNSLTTRNQRLAALHALFRFIGRQSPELVEHATQIRAIPPRRCGTRIMDYLDKPEIDAVLDAPDRQRAQGRRDHALLLFLYNTGARASEVVTVTVGDLALNTTPPSVRLIGKGRKARLCPLWDHTADVLRALLGSRIEGPRDGRVFLNVRGRPTTRFGIYTVVARAVAKAATTAPTLNKKRVSPHTIRHTTAMHLLKAGVDINTIRGWLGHVLLVTTNIYTEPDLEMKAKALERCAIREPQAPGERIPIWRDDRELMAFLKSL
jgi:site-specific recombinase XerD